MNEQIFKVLPIFPHVFGATIVTHNIDELWNTIDTVEWFKSTDDCAENGYVSKDLQLLDSIPNMRNLILAYFYRFKDEVLNYNTTDFDITTSWMTRTDPGGFCQHHNHKNSYYTGILYQGPTSDGSGNLCLSDSGIKNETMLLNTPSEETILNSKQLVIEPDTNLLVFFPSNIQHRISKYTGQGSRYSLAFNLFPKGILGSGDSSINLG